MQRNNRAKIIGRLAVHLILCSCKRVWSRYGHRTWKGQWQIKIEYSMIKKGN